MTKLTKGLLLATVLGLVLFGDVLISKAKFYSLCTREGGQEVLRTEGGVEGLLLTGAGEIGCAGQCMELLGKKKYKYVEVQVRIPYTAYLVSTSGLYRFHLADAGAPECSAYQGLVAKSSTLPDSYEKSFGIPRSSCIVGTSVSTPNANYQYERKHEFDYVESLGITRSTETLSDRRSGEAIATSTAFSRVNGWVLAATGLNPGPHEVCRPYDRSVIDKIETILKPA